MTTAAPEIEFELVAHRRGVQVSKDKFLPIPGRFESLPEVPKGFISRTGAYDAIAAIASKLNKAQMDHGFLDYLYSPDIVGAEGTPTLNM